MSSVQTNTDSESTGPSPLAAYLAANRAECPACGYSLRGLTPREPDGEVIVCPECGVPSTLEMLMPGRAVPLTPPMRLTQAFLGMAALHGVFMMLVVLTAAGGGPRRGSPVQPGLVFLGGIVLPLISVCMTLLWMRRVGRVATMTRRRQWGIMWAALGLLVVQVLLAMAAAVI